MTTINRSYKYRLYPTEEQRRTLEAWQVACWEVQRWCIKQRRWAERVKTALQRCELPLNPALAFPDPTVCADHQNGYDFQPNQHTQRYEVTARRAEREHWRAVPAHTMYEIVYRVEKAWGDAQAETIARRKANPARIAKGLKPIPDARARWADKATDVGLPFTHGIIGTIEIDGRFASVRVGNATKLGAFRFRYHRPIPDGSKIGQVYITHKIDGWYIAFACKIPTPEQLPETGHTVGVDLNCIHQGDNQDNAALSDSRIYSTPDHLKKSAGKLAHWQKMVDDRATRKGARHADPESNRTKKREKRIAKLHQRIARQRDHNLHYVARRIVDTADVIKFEDIDWSALRRQGTPREEGDNRRGGRKAKKGLNRSMSTASPGRLRETTEHKSEAAGRTCGRVPAQNTSKACSACGTILKEMTAATRAWTCPACGASHQRDVNAAKNIAVRAFKERKKKKTRSGYKPRRKER